MKKYVSIKTVRAEPLFLKAKNEQGFNVYHEDGAKSWVSLGVFDRDYKSAETWMERLIIEVNELTKKCKDLESALMGGSVPAGEVRILKKQLKYMKAYLSILHTRIQRA